METQSHLQGAVRTIAPQHHPSAELLLDYTTGAASAGEALMIAAHLAMCPCCCRAVGDCEAIGGAMLDALAPARLPPNLLNRTLAAIESAECERKRKLEGANRLPTLIRRYLSEDQELPPWRKQAGRIMTRILPVACPASQVVLIKIKPGGSVFRHTHTGEEWTQVLQGGLSDKSGHYGKGDFVRLTGADDHKPVAEPGEDCICVALLKGGLKYTGLVGRLAGPFIRF